MAMAYKEGHDEKSLSLMVFWGVVACVAQADVKMLKIFGDNMVLQRDQAVPVWG